MKAEPSHTFPFPSKYAVGTTERARILVVDDVREDQALLVDHLRQHGFRLFVADGGKQAYQLATGILPDLILLDVRMPDVDGFAACRLLKADARTADIPVIFITAANDVDDRVAGLTLGAVDYIGKPFDFAEVAARVKIHLGLARKKPATASRDGKVPASETQALLQAALAILDDRLDDPPSTEALAIAVGSHEKRLAEVFRSQLSTTVSGYVREERLRRSRELLAQTDMEIQSVGLLFGYASAANFATAFRQRFGLCPREYRRAIRAGKSGDEPA